MSEADTKRTLQLWVNAGLEKSGKTNTELARLLGIPQSRVSEMRRGIRMPKISELPIIAEYIEEPAPSELAAGLEMLVGQSLADKLKAQRLEAERLAQARVDAARAAAQARIQRQQPVAHYKATPEELERGQSLTAEIPLISWVSAGKMAFPDVSEERTGTLAAGDLDPTGDWIALKVVGDSMDRISPPESIIFVDRADKVLVPNACYVISNGDGEATYKRFRSNPMRFEPVSTNPAHEPIYPTREPLIVGRVKKSTIEM